MYLLHAQGINNYLTVERPKVYFKIKLPHPYPQWTLAKRGYKMLVKFKTV